MKIAYVGLKGLPARSGAERVAEAIVARLARRHQVTVYCNARYTPEGTVVPGVRLVRIPTPPGKYLQPVSLFILSALHALFRGGYDLVHLHNVEACAVLPVLRLRYPVIATSHGSPLRTARAKWGPVARALMGLTEYPFTWLPNCATSVSKSDAEYFQQRYRRTVTYVPNGVGEEYHNGETAEIVLRETGIQRGRYILFAAGRIDPTKGCHLVLDAFRRLDSDMKLVIVGDLAQVPEYAAHLRAKADERVVFVPLIAERKRLFSIVEQARLFVFPSIREAMSMMLLEVAAMGVPLICSDIADNTCVLGERTLYFRSGDAEDLTAKIRWALEHPHTMHALASQAQSWVKHRYSWDAIAAEYEALYVAHARCAS